MPDPFTSNDAPFDGRRTKQTPRDLRLGGRLAAVIGIARVSEVTGATVRALRHYEAVGLLSPIRSRDRGRWFTPDQAARAETIARLRRLDVPIDEIRTILAPARAEERRRAVAAILEAKASELEVRLADVRYALAGAAANEDDAEVWQANDRQTRRVLAFESRTQRAV
jgi:DNA-binding transcriptional MerR regulator